MNQIKCKIKSGIGKIYSINKHEVTSMDESFSFIKGNKYIGLSVEEKAILKSDVMYMAHYTIVKKSFIKNNSIIEKDRHILELTANWMLPYEKTCNDICIDILGEKLADKSAYSMDLVRFLEKIYLKNRLEYTYN